MLVIVTLLADGAPRDVPLIDRPVTATFRTDRVVAAFDVALGSETLLEIVLSNADLLRS